MNVMWWLHTILYERTRKSDVNFMTFKRLWTIVDLSENIWAIEEKKNY